MKTRIALSLLLLGLFPLWGGAFYRYSCVSPMKEVDAIQESRVIYFRKIEKFDPSLFRNFDSVRCYNMKVVDDVFFGLRVGSEWKVTCSYIEAGTVYDLASFQLNQCRASRYWEYGSDFPYPAADRAPWVKDKF